MSSTNLTNFGTQYTNKECMHNNCHSSWWKERDQFSVHDRVHIHRPLATTICHSLPVLHAVMKQNYKSKIVAWWPTMTVASPSYMMTKIYTIKQPCNFISLHDYSTKCLQKAWNPYKIAVIQIYKPKQCTEPSVNEKKCTNATNSGIYEPACICIHYLSMNKSHDR